MTKILGIIDSLGSGGAQRQMVNLLIGLHKQGHEADLFTYSTTSNFFKAELIEAHIPVYHFEKPKKGFSYEVILALRKHLKKKRYDITLSFLDGPNIYQLLAGMGLTQKKIVSERSSFLQEPHLWKRFLTRQFFRLSDAIVTNSYSEAEWLSRCAKLPDSKITTIYNGYLASTYEFQTFIPEDKKNLSLIGIGRINPEKNIEFIIEGLARFEKKNQWTPQFTWVGRNENERYFKKLQDQLERYPAVKKNWTWAGEVQNVPSLFKHHHALVLPSLYEGLPNVICEAFFSGLPVLASNRCDHPLLVKDNERGFLFDPISPDTMVAILEKLLACSSAKWKSMSLSARNYAEQTLTNNKMIEGYLSLISNISRD